MKRRLSVSTVRSFLGSGLFVGAVLLGGCGREEGRTAASSPVDPAIKGEPIRGEPIQKAAASASNVATTLAVAAASNATAYATSSPSAVPPVPSGNPGSALVAAAKPAAPASNGAPAAVAGDALVVGFDKLASFQYTLPDGPVDTNTVAATQASAQIPDTIRALNNRVVSLKGFMLPLKVEKGLVTELLIMRDQSMCCYGNVPRINEWVSVKMVGGGVKPIMDQAVTLFGKLKVGEMYENGYLVGIYALDGDRMAGPLDL